MTTQPENKDKAEQKVSKDELSEKELEKAAGGADPHPQIQEIHISKYIDRATP
jgi:type VI protein secretion system component Hcp